ncbi:uncharacterized protein LOC131334155 isoform X2 [Rhododendron vialii]|nr:uncharacterized protein LOC131334155 isoform X2 [Rhododendron vialii]
MEKIELDAQSSSSTNLKEDPFSKVIGPERNGRVRTFGKGVTKTKLTILSQMNGQMAEIREENVQCKSKIARMRNKIDELKKNQAQNPATEGAPTAPIVSPSSVNTTNPHSGKCILLDWMGTGDVVAEGCWSSSDPSATVHHVPIGPNTMRVWVVVPKKPEMFLWRQTSFMTTIEEAVGSTVAWPADRFLWNLTQGLWVDKEERRFFCDFLLKIDIGMIC